MSEYLLGENDWMSDFRSALAAIEEVLRSGVRQSALAAA